MTLAAYDLDGTLAEVVPPLSAKPWRFMKGAERAEYKARLLDFYRSAKPLYTPPAQKFHVITARKDDPEVRSVTEAWLEKHFGDRVLGVHMLKTSRTIENVVAFKSGVIRRLGVTDFVEDNPKVVKALRRTGVCTVWYFDGVFASSGGPR